MKINIKGQEFDLNIYEIALLLDEIDKGTDPVSLFNARVAVFKARCEVIKAEAEAAIYWAKANAPEVPNPMGFGETTVELIDIKIPEIPVVEMPTLVAPEIPIVEIPKFHE